MAIAIGLRSVFAAVAASLLRCPAAIAIGLGSVFAAVAAILLSCPVANEAAPLCGPAYNAAGPRNGATAKVAAQARTTTAQKKDNRFLFMADPFFTVRTFNIHKPRPDARDCQDDEKILNVFS
jgi:hypothetical protein